MTCYMSKKELSKPITFSSIFKSLFFGIILYILYWYVTHYSSVTAFFTDTLPTAFADFQDNVLQEFGGKYDLVTILLNLLWVIFYTIIGGLIVLFLWVVVGTLHKYYILPLIFAVVILKNESLRNAIISNILRTGFIIFFVVGLGFKLLILKFIPAVWGKFKLVIELIFEILVTILEEIFSYLNKKLKGGK